MDWLSLLVLIVSIGSIPLAVRMARLRARSPRVWFWIAFLIGPLAPLVLVMLGRCAGGARISATAN
jgi:hypothetical protein